MLLQVGGGAGGEGISEGVEEELLQLRTEAALVGSAVRSVRVGFDSHEFEEVEAAIEEGVEVRPGTAGLRRNLGNLRPSTTGGAKSGGGSRAGASRSGATSRRPPSPIASPRAARGSRRAPLSPARWASGARRARHG